VQAQYSISMFTAELIQAAARLQKPPIDKSGTAAGRSTLPTAKQGGRCSCYIQVSERRLPARPTMVPVPRMPCGLKIGYFNVCEGVVKVADVTAPEVA
jgi:hypothetical protein